VFMSMTGGWNDCGGFATLVLAKPNVPTVGEGCERSVGGVMEGVGGGAKRVPYKFVKFKLCCSGEASSTTKTVYFPPVC
jgi:hypothetical protein